MYKRKLTPYSGYPDMKALEDLELEHSELLTPSTEISVSRDDSTPSKKTKSKRKRTKSKSLSISTIHIFLNTQYTV